MLQRGDFFMGSFFRLFLFGLWPFLIKVGITRIVTDREFRPASQASTFGETGEVDIIAKAERIFLPLVEIHTKNKGIAVAVKSAEINRGAQDDPRVFGIILNIILDKSSGNQLLVLSLELQDVGRRDPDIGAMKGIEQIAVEYRLNGHRAAIIPEINLLRLVDIENRHANVGFCLFVGHQDVFLRIVRPVESCRKGQVIEGLGSRVLSAHHRRIIAGACILVGKHQPGKIDLALHKASLKPQGEVTPLTYPYKRGKRRIHFGGSHIAVTGFICITG